MGMPPAIDASSPSDGARDAPSTCASSTSVSGVSSVSAPSATNVSSVAAVKLFVQDATRKAVPVYVEATILELPRICINGGRRGYLVGIDPAVLTRLLGARPVNCAL